MKRFGKGACLLSTIALVVGATPDVGSAVTLRARGQILHLTPAGTSHGAVYTDGVRWAVYERATGMTTVLETASGHSRTSPNPSGCRLTAVGSGELLYRCEDLPCAICEAPSGVYPATWPVRYVVEDAASGQRVEVHRVPWTSPNPPFPTRIGRTWLEGETRNYKESTRFFVNWRTGTGSEGPSKLAPHEGLDLDAPSLVRRFCAPIKRPPSLPESIFGVPELIFEPPFAVSYIAGEPRGELRLLRCGRQQSYQLPADGWTLEVQLGGGVLSWRTVSPVSASGAMHVVRLSRSAHDWHEKILLLSGPHSHRGAAEGSLQHTANTVYLSYPLSANGLLTGTYAIWSAKIPLATRRG
jgi:hypothetical protein